MSERRKSQRVRVTLEARWEGVLARREGTIVDISRTGCFMLTGDSVSPGELIGLEIQMPTGRWIFIWAEVVYNVPEMGFALRFTGSADENEETMLEMLIAYASGKDIGVNA